LDLAGQQGAAVHRSFFRDVHPTQVQVDELWNFVKKQAPLQPGDPADWGDAWIGRALALPRHLRVVTHLSHERSEEEATAFLAACKAPPDGHVLLFPSDQLPAYVAALIVNYSTPEPPLAQGGHGRPHPTPRRMVDTALLDAQVDTRREQGRVVEVCRRIIFRAHDIITKVLGGQQINTASGERDNLTSRQGNGREVRKTLSHSKKSYVLGRHLDLEAASFNFVRPHQALRIAVLQPTPGRKWQQRTPAIAAELTDHIWGLEELLSYRIPPPKD
jgi:hypothetical protein